MQIKSYTAIFFALIFLGKFLMLDARMLTGILASEEIALVNPFCKKSIDKSADAETLSESASVLVISSDAMCNTPFYIPKISLPEIQRINNFQVYSYLNPAVISTYFSKNYPPPKVLVA